MSGAGLQLGGVSPVVERPHPRGMAGVRDGAREIVEGILRDRKDPLVIAWTRQTIHAANLPDPRGFPVPRNVMGALFAQLKKEVAFVRDPVDSEMMAGTREILCLDPSRVCLRGEDCDGQLRALGSAAASAGIALALRTRRYKGARQCHVDLLYDTEENARAAIAARVPVTAATRGPWQCIDPSVESGNCAGVVPEEEFIMEIASMQEPTHGTFIGIGRPPEDAGAGAGDVGDPPVAQLSDSDAAALVQMLTAAKAQLDHSVARLTRTSKALTQVRADLGYPTADAASTELPTSTSPLLGYMQTSAWTSAAQTAEANLVQTATFLSQVCADGLNGTRSLYWNNGDLFVSAKPGDPYRVLMSPDANGNMIPTYFDTSTNQPSGAIGWAQLVLIGVIVAAVSVVAVVSVVKICNTISDVHVADVTAKSLAFEQDMVTSGKATPAQAAQMTSAAAGVATAMNVPKPLIPPLGGGGILGGFATALQWGLVLAALAAGGIAGFEIAKKYRAATSPV